MIFAESDGNYCGENDLLTLENNNIYVICTRRIVVLKYRAIHLLNPLTKTGEIIHTRNLTLSEKYHHSKMADSRNVLKPVLPK